MHEKTADELIVAAVGYVTVAKANLFLETMGLFPACESLKALFIVGAGMADEKKTLYFHYLKSPLYRTFHVDGALGGPTPSGGVWITIFSERAPIPRMTENEIGEDGSVGAEVNRESKTGVIRDVECGLVMTKQTALRLHKWLGILLHEMKGGTTS
jgi:hypothetical protein